MLAVSACLVVAGLAVALALALYTLASRPAPAPVAKPRAVEAPVASESRERAAVAPLAPPARVELARMPEPVAEPSPEPAPALPGNEAEEWPPARAFTARCRAPGGGCNEQCTRLAGGRCLDPCFIHTGECSRDCLNLDGTCGWPPPDTE